MGEYVIFAIDNDDDAHTNAKFMRHMDTLDAMSKMRGNMKLCIGSYKNKLERSYLVRFDDFFDHVAESGYVDDQESILVLRDGYYGRTYATLKYEFVRDKAESDEFLGLFKHRPADEAMAGDAWTYRPDLDLYFITEEV